MSRTIAERVRCLIAALALGLVAIGTGCTENPSATQCKSLLGHVLDLEMKDSGARGELSADMQADLKEQRKQLEKQVSEQFLATCSNSLPVQFVECGLKAKTKAEYANCDRSI